VLVDLSEQVLTAYEGERLVFATLVSSGRRIKTPKGSFGLERKYRYKTMAGEVLGESYRVSNVPWAQFFSDSYALHGAFWHNKFGRTASHGCVNLEPDDAKFMAEFLDPVLPPGWLAIFPPAANLETSRVIVRE
jgi:lipoprotein-anchoring transpeptidase ErfK/SrfK